MEAAGTPVALEGHTRYRPSLANRVSRIARTVRFRGVGGSLAHYSQRALRLALRRAEPVAALDQTAADARFAQTDGGNAALTELVIQSENYKWGLPYAPVIADIFHRGLAHLSIPFDQYDFIDLGAGKGLPVLLAAQYPFKRITGVEYAKALAESASDNIAAFCEENHDTREICCLWGDATEFAFPAHPTVLYLNNPFQGKVMDQVIQNLEASLHNDPRDLWVVYGIPWEGRKFRRHPMFQAIEENQDYCVFHAIPN